MGELYLHAHVHAYGTGICYIPQLSWVAVIALRIEADAITPHTTMLKVPCRWRVDASHSVFTDNPDEFQVLPKASEAIIAVGGTAR